MKTIKISIKPLKECLKEFARTFSKLKNGEKVTPHHEISFESVKALNNFLNEKR